MSNYQLKDEVRNEYAPIVSNFIAKVEAAHKKKTVAAELATSKKRSRHNNDEDNDEGADEDEG